MPDSSSSASPEDAGNAGSKRATRIERDLNNAWQAEVKTCLALIERISRQESPRLERMNLCEHLAMAVNTLSKTDAQMYLWANTKEYMNG